MSLIQVTNWPIEKCKTSPLNIDSVFYQPEELLPTSKFIRPFVAQKNKEFAEILLGFPTFIKNYDLSDIKQIPLYILPESCSKIQIFEHILEYYQADHFLNISSISRLICILKKSHIEQQEFQQFITRKLKISPREKNIQKYMDFSSINQGVIDFLLTKKAPLKLWEYFVQFSEIEQELVEKFINQEKPGLGILTEIIINIMEYSKIKSQKPLKIFKKILFEDILNNGNINNKKEYIRNKLSQMRYPILINHRKTVDNNFAKLTIPNNFNLQYDKNLEKKEIRVNILIKTEDDVNQIQKFFSDKNNAILKDTLDKM